MANQSAKRIAASNARLLRQLAWGGIVVNVIYIVYRLFLKRSATSTAALVLYLVSQAVSLLFHVQIVSMSRIRRDGEGRTVSGGSDLSQEGLVQYMFDIIYLTWFCTIGSLLTDKIWYTFLVVPLYAAYKVSGLARSFLGQSKPRLEDPHSATDRAQSKRQAKLAKRAEGGGGRSQVVYK